MNDEIRIPTIKTDRIVLREIVNSDKESILHGLSDPHVTKHYGIRFDSLEAVEEQMKWLAEPSQYWWAICSTDNSKFYGAGGLNNLSHEHKKAEIGLWLLPSYWGKGILKEAIPIICEYGFKQLGLHRIEGLVETKNINCKKAMSKLNFTHEGTMEDCEVKNGKFISLDIYAKLNKASS